MRGSTLNGWLVDNMNPDLNLYWMLLDVSVPPPPPKKKEERTQMGYCCATNGQLTFAMDI